MNHVRESGLTNMMDRKAVQYHAFQDGYYETVSWLEENPKLYIQGVIEGFEVE